jgi:hypothetical protein
MKRKILFLGAAFLLILFAQGREADIIGNWIAKIPASQGAVNTAFTFEAAREYVEMITARGETVFSFKVNGKRLEGTVSDPQGKTAISEGEINGDDISFVVSGNANGNGITLAYRGKIGLNEIKFTREPKDGTGRPQEFIATREFLRHNDYIPRPVSIPVQPPRTK